MKRIISFALIVILLLPFVVSCSEDVSTDPIPDATTAGTGDTTQPTTEKLRPDLPEKDFGGRTFTFLVTGPEYGYGYYETIDVYEESPSSDVFKDSVYQRNTYVEEKYNVKIREVKSNSVISQAQKAISAGDTSYDAIFTSMYESATMAQNNLLLDLRKVKYIDLSSPWWDQNAEKELSLGGKLYFTTGEISTMDNACTRLLIFNKKLVREYGLDDPYEHVKNDTWTLEKYAEMVKQVHSDLNGNGEFDDEDLYGTIMEAHNPLYLVRGFGERLTTNDEQDYPEVTFMTERMINAVNKIWDIYFDETVCRSVSKMKASKDYSNVFTYARGLFANDKFLFHLGAPLILSEFRNMESEFGLLPSPKLDTQQERYYHAVDPEASMLCIPVTNTNEDTGIIIEAMAAESMYTITPAYNEIVLKRKYTRDEESQLVLDIVNQTRTYDLCTMYTWGGLSGMLNNLTDKKQRDIMSAYDKISVGVKKAIDKTVNAFSENN
ncbi:MAG: extracellular solute-binding protein [Eubacteriales bacterium]